MANNDINQSTSSTSGFVKFPSPQDGSTQKNPILPKPAKPISTPSIPKNQNNASNTNSGFPFPSDRFGDFGFPTMNGSNGENGDKTEMIKKVYKDILGKEAEPRDISYYRFSPMGEEEIKQQLISGKEHKDLIEKGNKYQEVKQKLDTVEAKVKVLEGKINDQLEEFNQLHNLLKEKNRYIRQLRQGTSDVLANELAPENMQINVDSNSNEQQIPNINENSIKEHNLPDPNVEPPDPPMPHFTDENISNKSKHKGILSNIFRS